MSSKNLHPPEKHLKYILDSDNNQNNTNKKHNINHNYQSKSAVKETHHKINPSLNKSSFSKLSNIDSKTDFRLYSTKVSRSFNFNDRNEDNSFFSAFHLDKSHNNSHNIHNINNKNSPIKQHHQKQQAIFDTKIEDGLLGDPLPTSKFSENFHISTPMTMSITKQNLTSLDLLGDDHARVNSIAKDHHNKYTSIPSFGSINIPEKVELGQFIAQIEARFLKIEQRVETNESLIHLHQEMQDLKLQESKAESLKDENIINKIYNRLEDMESRIKTIEDNIKTLKVQVNFQIDDFTKKVEKLLEKFSDNTLDLTQKVDKIGSIKNIIPEKKYEDSLILLERKIENFSLVENKFDRLADEMRDKLKNICDVIKDLSKLTNNTDAKIKIHSDTLNNLETDFLKMINSYKDFSQNVHDYRWLSDEVSLIKLQQMQLIKLINQHGEKTFVNQPQLVKNRKKETIEMEDNSDNKQNNK